MGAIDRLVLLLCVVVFTDTFGYAIVIPLLPFAAEQFGATTIGIGVIFASYSLCQIAASPLLGALSDRFGRKPVLTLSLAGSALGFLLLAGARSLLPVVVSRVIDGATAGNVSIVNAMVLDAYPHQRWGNRLAILSTAIGLGILGGLIVSSLLAGYGLTLAASVALGLSVLSIGLVLFLLPETGARRPMAQPSAIWRELTRGGPHGMLRRAIPASLLSTITQSAFILGLPLFLASRLGFAEQASGATIAALFGIVAVFQVAALPRLVSVLGDRRSAMIGFGVVLGGGLGIAWLAADLVGVLVFGGVTLCGIALLNPSMTALVAACNRRLDQGVIMGINQSVASLGFMIGPLLAYAALATMAGGGYGTLCAALAAGGMLAMVGIGAIDGGD